MPALHCLCPLMAMHQLLLPLPATTRRSARARGPELSSCFVSDLNSSYDETCPNCPTRTLWSRRCARAADTRTMKESRAAAPCCPSRPLRPRLLPVQQLSRPSPRPSSSAPSARRPATSSRPPPPSPPSLLPSSSATEHPTTASSLQGPDTRSIPLQDSAPPTPTSTAG